MKIDFISPDPHGAADSRMDDVLAFGTDELAMAFCYLTEPGLDFIKPHALRLTQTANCFAVFSDEDSNKREVLWAAKDMLRDHVRYHRGGLSPQEYRNGPRMHSKLIYARRGDTCRLWVGSHNLTRNALIGANIEAALCIEGLYSEQIFRDARSHLDRVFIGADPDPGPGGTPPPPNPAIETLLHVHAECHEPTALQCGNFPMHIELRLDVTDCDSALLPSPITHLYLYAPGDLAPSRWRSANPVAAYVGKLMGFNSIVPGTTTTGTPATWPQTTYTIDNADGPPVLRKLPTAGHGILSQAMLSFLVQVSPPKAVHFSGSYSFKEQEAEGERIVLPLSALVPPPGPVKSGQSCPLFDEFVARVLLPPRPNISDPDLRERERDLLSTWFRRLGHDLELVPTQLYPVSHKDLRPFIRRTTRTYSEDDFV